MGFTFSLKMVGTKMYQDPGTKILVPRSWYQDPGTKILVPGTARHGNIWHGMDPPDLGTARDIPVDKRIDIHTQQGG